MKLVSFLGVMVVLIGFIAGCGGSDNGSGPQARPCSGDGDCDDGAYCNGPETCVQGFCAAGDPPCDDGNPCTDDCVEFPGICRAACGASGPADSCCADPVCSEDPVCIGFPGGTYNFQVSDLSQTPGGCLMTPSLLELIMSIIGGSVFPIQLPPQSAYPTDIELQFGVLGPVTVHAEFDSNANQIGFERTQIQDEDLGFLGIPGLNCLVGGWVSGETTQLDPNFVAAAFTLDTLSVGIGTGTGGCSFNQPGPGCSLLLSTEGELVETGG